MFIKYVIFIFFSLAFGYTPMRRPKKLKLLIHLLCQYHYSSIHYYLYCYYYTIMLLHRQYGENVEPRKALPSKTFRAFHDHCFLNHVIKPAAYFGL